jgi:hypothetical protein
MGYGNRPEASRCAPGGAGPGRTGRALVAGRMWVINAAEAGRWAARFRPYAGLRKHPGGEDAAGGRSPPLHGGARAQQLRRDGPSRLVTSATASLG